VFRPDHDLAGTIARLFIHPVKSCAGIEVREALLTDTGLDLDRAWMVVDPQGVFLTQRDWPRMALVRPELRSSDLVLRAPGMLALHLSLDRVEQPATVRVWDDTVPAWDMGAVAAQWFTDFLGTPCRLVRFDPAHRRLSSLKWTGGVEAHDEDRIDGLHILADGGEAWLQHVKPCTRCPIPDIDPATAQRGTAVGDTLRGYRQDARMNGGITFGMNAIVREGAGLLLRVGQPVAANLKFD
jgi:uncharacterized protein YcbX